MMSRRQFRCRANPLVVGGLIIVALCPHMSAACDNCGCDGQDGGEVCAPHVHGPGEPNHTHGGAQILSFANADSSAARAAASSGPIRFAVLGDTQNGEFGGHGNLLTRLMERIAGLNPDFVVFPGDLVADSGVNGWQAWKNRTAVLGLNSAGVDKRLMTPGNHDRGTGGTFANWQTTFDWLPDSQLLNGKKGVDQVDYFVDQGNVRFVSVSTDRPGQGYGGIAVDEAPPALDWMREVMKDVENRNSDPDPNNNIDHVFTFSHRPITTQMESPTGGTDGDWWRSMTGQDPSSTTVSTAFLPGHWHMYQPSRPDPRVDTMEIIGGTGGGGLEGQAHRNRHGFTFVTVDGSNVTADFYGDANQGNSDTWNFSLLDSFIVAQAGGLPTGELARYQFTNAAADQDSSVSPLSKGHALHYVGSAQSVNDQQQGNVLRVFGDGASYVDAKNIGDNNLAVLGDLTISLFAKAASLGTTSGDNTLVAFGGAHGAANSSLSQQESANHAYKLAISSGGNLQFSWQHDDSTWEMVISDGVVANPGQWHEYEVRRDADNKAVAFFIDGLQLGRALAFDFLPTGAGSGSLYIGSDIGGALGYAGWIDDVRINSDPVSVIPWILGDFDGNGTIDGGDWSIYVAGLGSAMPGPTDLNGDGLNNHADFLAFKKLFNDFNGVGAFELMVNDVPEPTALTLVAMGGIHLLRRLRKPQSRKRSHLDIVPSLSLHFRKRLSRSGQLEPGKLSSAPPRMVGSAAFAKVWEQATTPRESIRRRPN